MPLFKVASHGREKEVERVQRGEGEHELSASPLCGIFDSPRSCLNLPRRNWHPLNFSIMSSITDNLTAAAVQDRVNDLLLSTGITYKEYVLGFSFAVYGLETYLR
jgi:hypothetical protein